MNAHATISLQVCQLLQELLQYQILCLQTQRLNSEGRYVQAQWYSRRAITCNLLAFGQYIVLVMATAISMFILFYI